MPQRRKITQFWLVATNSWLDSTSATGGNPTFSPLTGAYERKGYVGGSWTEAEYTGIGLIGTPPVVHDTPSGKLSQTYSPSAYWHDSVFTVQRRGDPVPVRVTFDIIHEDLVLGVIATFPQAFDILGLLGEFIVATPPPGFDGVIYASNWKAIAYDF